MATELLGLQQPFTADGIETVNFFNGRLLTGTTMEREQATRRAADARLGCAIGDGVACGLEVSFAGPIAPGRQPVARVSSGLAINREGHTLCLQNEVTIALAAPPARPLERSARLFDTCPDTLATGDYVAGQGLFLLTISPAFAKQGRAQASGLDQASVRCNSDATVEGVQFRLLAIDPSRFGGASFAANDFRNRIAYRAFGAGVGARWPGNLVGAEPRGDDLIEELRRNGLSDSEVPLALMAFAGSFDHRFTDMWSVRRPIALSDGSDFVANLADPRRTVVGRAMFRQFQAHIGELAAATGRVPATARGHFPQLPPAGLLTFLSDDEVAAFFAGMTVRGPVHIDASAVEPLIRESFTAPAINTDSAEAIWLYRIAQTVKARGPNRLPPPADILLFASGHLPYRADARFDLNFWNYANYALMP